MRVLAFTKYGLAAASARQRFALYAPALAAENIRLDIHPLLDDRHMANLNAGRKSSPLAIVSSYLKRLGDIAGAARRADVLWVHCELFPYWPALAERLAFASGRPVVFDYDDAIFHMYDDAPNPLVRGLLGGKLKPLIRGAAAVTAGNRYLADYAKALNSNVLVVPTVVDTDLIVPRSAPRTEPPVIGWIGSPSTWPYVDPLHDLLEGLVRSGRARFVAVGAGAAADPARWGWADLRAWTEAGELADLQAMDIGIMPVPDDRWERGKSGYKLVQYMACGIPGIASPVGVNAQMLGSGDVGLLATTPGEWAAALDRLLGDADLRTRMGAAGRMRALSDYSLASQAPRLAALFKSLGER